MKNNRQQKILLVAPFPPEGGGGGGVIMRSLLADYPKDLLTWFTLSGDKTQKSPWWRPQIKRGSSRWRVAGRRFEIIRKLAAFGPNQAEAHLNATDTIRFIATEKPDIVWFVSTYQSLDAFDRIRRRGDFAYHLSIHDDPFVAATLSGNRITARDESNFANLVTHAHSMDCVSERMRSDYLRRFGKDSIVITRGFDGEGPLNTIGDPLVGDRDINILLGGWGDCPPPWPQNLLAAVEQGRGIRNYHVYSFDPIIKATQEYLHHMPRLQDNEFNTLMRSMTIGYACDPFTPAGLRFAATSFSTKVVTYIGNGLPFVYHGPADSVVGDLLREYRCGTIVDSQDPREILRGFEKVLGIYQQLRSECIRARNEIFNADCIRNRFFNYFGVAETNLGRSLSDQTR